MADHPSVAVVILNWNGEAFLQQFLPAVCMSDYPGLAVYVADNASTDNSLSFVRKNFPRVAILQNGGNIGFAGGYNRALAQIKTDYYILLNQDVAVTGNWIRPVISLMESRAVIGACQPKILSQKRPDHFEYAGAAGGWIDRWGYPFCRGRIFDTAERDAGQYDEAGKVFWATGAALFIRAELYHRAGGLDPHFFAHMEEIDLCWRLQRLGYEIWCCPQSVVYHVGGGSLPQGDPRKMFLNFRNNLIMLYKNLSGPERSYTVFARFVLDGLAGIKSLLQGRPGEVLIILKAHLAFYRWLFKKKKYTGGGRRAPVPFIPFRAIPGVYRRSIVWQYFVRDKKTFSALRIVDK